MSKTSSLLIAVVLMLFQYSHSYIAPPYSYPDWVESPTTSACLAFESTPEIVPDQNSIVPLASDYTFVKRNKMYVFYVDIYDSNSQNIFDVHVRTVHADSTEKHL